jgi:hypothetical protein
MKATVRTERFKHVPSYDAAFDNLTKFYKRRKISHDRDPAAVVDMTGDEEDEELAGDGLNGSMDLDGGDELHQASGTTGELNTHCSRLH